MLLAASTQRTIGYVILAIVFIGGLVYLFFNIRAAKGEVGSEIELAANRRDDVRDEDLEGKRLDFALGANLVMLTIIGVSLPLYWLGEPGRHAGRDEDTARIFTNRGEEIYLEGAECVTCHGAEGSGGSTSVALTSESGEFIAQVSWDAPALNTVMSRFSEDEILHTLNYGRNGVMPAWGAPGGGPLTDQQLEEVMFYLRSIQISPDRIADQVEAGVLQAVRAHLAASGEEATDEDARQWIVDAQAVAETARQTAIEQDASLGLEQNAEDLRWAALDILVSGEGLDPEAWEQYKTYGALLFANPGTAGTYSCARCHTYGFSFGGAEEMTMRVNGRDTPIEGFEDGLNQAGGFFGPNLQGGATLAEFESPRSHAEFIEQGQTIGLTYGRGGSGGNGQMPGFGPRVETDTVGPGIPNDLETPYPATLTAEQIDAIVAYERNL
ncbi:MAG: cytochrome c [Acidimicrobiaceae bacterium]|nr:cytochrome c [Acidimicrobiaceae bacterium]MXW63047.1 cytochrome c [Acidimicrobiaceae bacterium]MXW75312.1 cytochrome c [Acidimicrobiaceae bacterium]MYC42691.1 cytochrome c [Acidimicrobiaceae bacterium]MYD07159.1 cytochrome c [Acidimicrobiaceae bacterium]